MKFVFFCFAILPVCSPVYAIDEELGVYVSDWNVKEGSSTSIYDMTANYSTYTAEFQISYLKMNAIGAPANIYLYETKPASKLLCIRLTAISDTETFSVSCYNPSSVQIRDYAYGFTIGTIKVVTTNQVADVYVTGTKILGAYNTGGNLTDLAVYCHASYEVDGVTASFLVYSNATQHLVFLWVPVLILLTILCGLIQNRNHIPLFLWMFYHE